MNMIEITPVYKSEDDPEFKFKCPECEDGNKLKMPFERCSACGLIKR